MPKVKVTTTTKASPGGAVVETYEAGSTYEMTDELAGIFLREGWGVDPDAPVAPKVTKPAPAPRKRKG